VADKTPKRQTGLGTSAFFRTAAPAPADAPTNESPDTPIAGEEVEEITMPPAPPKQAARAIKQATTKVPQAKRLKTEASTESAGREKVSYSLAEITVNRLEALKSHYRLSYKSRTTYGKLLDEAVRLLAEREGLL
jgi:hypothetical protein